MKLAFPIDLTWMLVNHFDKEVDVFLPAGDCKHC